MNEIAIEGENITCVQLVGHLNKTGIGEADRKITIFAQNGADRCRRAGELERYLKNPLFHIGQDPIRSSGNLFKQKATLGENRFTSSERLLQLFQDANALLMIPLSSVKQSNDYTAIKQDRLHRP